MLKFQFTCWEPEFWSAIIIGSGMLLGETENKFFYVSVDIGCVRDYRCENKEKSIGWFFCVSKILAWVVGTGFSLILEVFSWKCWWWPFSAWLEAFFSIFCGTFVAFCIFSWHFFCWNFRLNCGRQTSLFPDVVLMLFSNLHKVIKPSIPFLCHNKQMSTKTAPNKSFTFTG